MEPIEFTLIHIEELEQRLSHSNELFDKRNFKKNEREITKQFLDDQGISFELGLNNDIDKRFDLITLVNLTK